MTEAGFDITPGVHPIVPIMLYDAVIAQEMAQKLLRAPRHKRVIPAMLLLPSNCIRKIFSP